MEQPEGYKKGDKVCLLKRSIYGLKQSPRQWNRRFNDFMKSQDFVRSSYDSCAYYKSYGEGKVSIYSYMLTICWLLLKI